MNLGAMKNVVTSQAARQILLTKKHSPVLLFGAGVAGVIGSTILACKATLKVEEVLDEHEFQLEQFDKARALDVNNYTAKDEKRDRAVLMAKTSVNIARLYTPAVVVGGLSVAALTGSHVILTKRNASITAAYAAVDKAFRQYRERVTEEVGPEKERELRYNVETTHRRVDDTKKGEVKVEELRAIRGGDGLSEYARLFGPDTSKEWNRDPATNLFYIKCQQNYLNDRLKSRGHVLLNDAYDALGLDRTSAGCVVGWVWDSDEDNFIDFGVFRDDNMNEMHSFMIGREQDIWLDFNVDGLVYDLVGRR